MYDIPGAEEVKNELTLRNCREVTTPDFTDLSTPEVSFDLQNFINESANQTTLEDNLFDLLPEKNRCYNPIQQGSNRAPFVGFPMPQQSIQANRYGSEAGSLIKQEPTEGHKLELSDNGSSQSTYNLFNYSQNDNLINHQILGTYTPAGYNRPGLSGIEEASSPSHNGQLKSPASSIGSSSSKNKKKNVDKNSDEYRRRRERNNIAVRKSREKAKQRSRDTERRVSDLAKENDNLRKRVDTLTKELAFLKSLLGNAGISPQNIESEIAKALRQESYR